MPCACNNKKKHLSKAAQLVTKVRVTCPECTIGLLGFDGTEYPVHLTPVIVSVQQVEAWQNAGHEIQILA